MDQRTRFSDGEFVFLEGYQAEAVHLLAEGRIKTEGIISPIVPFADAAEAYRAIDERPAESIKLGIRFP